MDFNKNNNGLLPAIVQDAVTNKVLMLGYMDETAYNKTLTTKKVTFYSRSKKRLWTKGEESGNFLNLVSIEEDCDGDTFLVKVFPQGPTCHKGTDTCWGDKNTHQSDFLRTLEEIIAQRKGDLQEKNSYVSSLFNSGINKIAQKVGEEAVEVVIEAKDNDPDLFLNESADLLFHYLILLQAKDFKLEDVVDVLQQRHQAKR